MTPTKVLEAAALMKTGKIYSLGRVYEAGMPFFGTRGWNLKIPGPPFFGPVGRNKIIANEEYLCAEIGQVGTQFDGLAHIGVESKGPSDNSGKLYYNGLTQWTCMVRLASRKTTFKLICAVRLSHRF